MTNEAHMVPMATPVEAGDTGGGSAKISLSCLRQFLGRLQLVGGRV